MKKEMISRLWGGIIKVPFIDRKFLKAKLFCILKKLNKKRLLMTGC